MAGDDEVQPPSEGRPLVTPAGTPGEAPASPSYPAIPVDPAAAEVAPPVKAPPHKRTGTFQAVGKPGRTPTTGHIILPGEISGAVDPSKTGFFKPLPPTGRAERMWAQLGLKIGQRAAFIVRDDHIYLLLMAALVGTTSGAAAGLLLTWIDAAHGLFATVVAEGIGVEWAVLALSPLVGGLLIGGMRVLMRRRKLPMPEGVPDVIEGAGARGGRLRAGGGAVLGLGTGLTIASGGSAGHEGPTVAIGAAVGASLARFFGLRLRRQVAMLGAGCAAGLAAAFNAPLAGVIFTVEVVFRRSIGGNVGTMSVFVPLIVAAVAGTFTSHAIFGERTEFADFVGGTGDMPILELLFFGFVAIACALMAPLFTRSIVWSGDRFKKSKLPEWIQPAVGMGSVGFIVVAAAASLTWLMGDDPGLADLLGSGRGIVARALHAGVAWKVAGIILLLKILLTALTIGSGGMGGIFMPSLVIGACIGVLVHAFATLVLGTSASAASVYALVGMGAFLGATLRAPLTPIVMIFELTHEYSLILPLMFACILSAFVAGRLGRETLFESILRRRGAKRPAQDEGESAFREGHVGDLMDPPDHMLRMDSTFEEVQRAVTVERSSTLYVLDERERVEAMIDTREVAARALRGEVPEGALAKDVAAKGTPTLLYADDTLAGAMLAFARAGVDVLPVVDRERAIRGLIERNDLLSHYSRHVLEGQQGEVEIAAGGAGPGREVGLGLGVILERVVVDRSWAGRSLAELDLRGQFDVHVLEWRRDETILKLDPRKPLREGDVLAIAGTRENILALRWT